MHGSSACTCGSAIAYINLNRQHHTLTHITPDKYKTVHLHTHTQQKHSLTQITHGKNKTVTRLTCPSCRSPGLPLPKFRVLHIPAGKNARDPGICRARTTVVTYIRPDEGTVRGERIQRLHHGDTQAVQDTAHSCAARRRDEPSDTSRTGSPGLALSYTEILHPGNYVLPTRNPGTLRARFRDSHAARIRAGRAEDPGTVS